MKATILQQKLDSLHTVHKMIQPINHTSTYTINMNLFYTIIPQLMLYFKYNYLHFINNSDI